MPDMEKLDWYVVHTYSGYENKVMDSLKKTVENRNLPTAGNMRWRNEPFNVTLKEILHNEL